MKILDKIIKRLEDEEQQHMGGYVKLSDLSEQDRVKMIEKFSEGRESLRNLLTIAYENGMESIFCCAGHDEAKYGNNKRYGYVTFKVTAENLEKLRQMGKIISNYDIVTNFDEHYLFGVRCEFRPMHKPENKDWFDIATKAIQEPEKMNNNPTIYYHENISRNTVPFKHRFLNFLKKINGNSVKKLETTSVAAKQNSGRGSFRDGLKHDVTENVSVDKNNERMAEDKNIGIEVEYNGGEEK